MLAGLLRITTEGMPRRVVFKRTSLVFCQVIIFNLVATPFLVNIFEASSFDEAPRLSGTFPKPASYSNHTSSRVFANHLQMHYNASSLPPQARVGGRLYSLAYIIAALLPLAQSQWPPLVEVYTWLFSIVRTFDEEGQTVTLDNVFVMIVYLLSMCAMPFGVGIAQDLWRKLHRRLYPKQRVSPSKFHTKLATQSLGKPRIRRHSRGSKGRIKNSRVASHCFHAKSSVSEYFDSTFRAPSATDGVFHGDGTLGELFRLNPLVRVQATLSQRGISCRVRGYDSQDTLVDDARVHLISQIDTKQIRLFQSQDSQAAVGVLVLLLGDTEKLEVVLHRGRLNSPWIIS
ncbi:hypothetical protein AeMF1_001511 [Aphanomyces euteiches]|nr:hypothetical protein AeMF1_001511 [Aphanomyces euteiches]